MMSEFSEEDPQQERMLAAAAAKSQQAHAAAQQRPMGASSLTRQPRAFPVILVQGTAGGLGTSTLAVLLASACARFHSGADGQRPTLLVDTHPDRVGLDMIPGLEENPGLRWQDIHAPLGVVDGQTLVARFPEADGIRVLAGRPWSGACPRPWEQAAVFDAVLQLPGPLVLEGGTGIAPPKEAVSALQRAQVAKPLLCIVAAPTLSSLATAQVLVGRLRQLFPSAPLGAVISTLGPVSSGGLFSSRPSAGQIADFLQIPVVGKYSCLPRFSRQIEAGVGVERVPARLARLCRRVLRRLSTQQARVGAHGMRPLTMGKGLGNGFARSW